MPLNADGMIDGNVEPTPSSGEAPSARIAGVETTAPPTPNIPDSTPVAMPASIVSSVLHGSDMQGDDSGGPHSQRARRDEGASLRAMVVERLLHGVYVPLVTPFAADGSVAVDVVERLAHEYVAAGARGIVALGTTGESAALEAREQQAVIAACRARAPPPARS